MQLDRASFLPDDGCAGTLVARIWSPGNVPGPAVTAVRDGGVFDLSARFPMSALLDEADPAAQVRATPGKRVSGLDKLLANSVAATRDAARAHLLAPCDLQLLEPAVVPANRYG